MHDHAVDPARQKLHMHLDQLTKTLRYARVDAIAKGLHHLSELVVFKSKTFKLEDGTTEKISFVLKIAVCHGRHIWACADGRVIKEGRPKEASIIIEQPLCPDNNTFFGQYRWAASVSPGISTPLSYGHLALVLYDITRWAVNSKQGTGNIGELQLVKSGDLIGMLKALYMERTKQEEASTPKARGSPTAAHPLTAVTSYGSSNLQQIVSHNRKPRQNDRPMPKVGNMEHVVGPKEPVDLPKRTTGNYRVDFSRFRNEEAEAEFHSNGSVAIRNDEHTPATIHNLTVKLGKSLTRYLPTILDLEFSEIPRMFHMDDDHLPLRLLIGTTFYRGRGNAGGVYVYYNTTPATATTAPAIKFNTGGPVDTPDHDSDSDDEERHNYEPSQFRSKVLAGEIHLHKMYRLLITKPEEFKAVTKYCFILASESNRWAHFDHMMPLNPSFERQLEKACLSIQKNEQVPDSSDRIATSPQRHPNDVRRGRNRRTNNGSDAPKEVQSAGFASLEDRSDTVATSIDARQGRRRGPVSSYAVEHTPLESHQVKRDERVDAIVFDSDSEEETQFLNYKELALDIDSDTDSQRPSRIPRLSAPSEELGVEGNSASTGKRTKQRKVGTSIDHAASVRPYSSHKQITQQRAAKHTAIARDGIFRNEGSPTLALDDDMEVDGKSLRCSTSVGEQDKENAAMGAPKRNPPNSPKAKKRKASLTVDSTYPIRSKRRRSMVRSSSSVHPRSATDKGKDKSTRQASSKRAGLGSRRAHKPIAEKSRQRQKLLKLAKGSAALVAARKKKAGFRIHADHDDDMDGDS